MSIVKQTRCCVSCGKTFKVDSRLEADECWPCAQHSYESAMARRAEEHAAAMEIYAAEHAGEDPFVNHWGTDLSVGMKNTGKR